MGLAIAGMHYVGMAGMRMSADVVYDPLLVAASVGVAITVSFAALALTRNLIENRLEPGKASLYLRMIGDDKFERISYDDWKVDTRKEADTSQNNLPSKIEEAKSAILDFLSDGSKRRTDEVIAHLKTHDIGENTTRDALRELAQTHLKVEKQGHTTLYKLDDDGLSTKETDYHYQVLPSLTLLGVEEASFSNEEDEEYSHNLDAFR